MKIKRLAAGDRCNDLPLFEVDFVIDIGGGERVENNGWLIYANTINEALAIIQQVKHDALNGRWQIASIRQREHSIILLTEETTIVDND